MHSLLQGKLLHNATPKFLPLINISDNMVLQLLFQNERCCCNVQRTGVFLWGILLIARVLSSGF
jgi:hypothetical protein